MNNYLIPANSKNGQLILGMFKPSDLWLLGIGVLTSVLMLAFLPVESLGVTILVLLPGIVSALLVFPIPNYHNTLTVIIEIYEYLTSRQQYRWKGWCYKEWLKK
ncbi:MAG: hypothetical protein PUC82_04235 [bacterium]|nr:hypothetical protein [bacterium]